MARVGLIGVGDMGSGMAANILKNGHELVVYDLRPEQVEPFVERGAYAAKNVGEVGERTDFVFVMVMNGDQIKAILNNGLLDGMKPGSTFICTATILRSELVEIAQSLKEREIRVIDAPVSGGAPGAAAGTLTMMVAAQRNVFEDATEVLKRSRRKHLPRRRRDRSRTNRESVSRRLDRRNLRGHLRNPITGRKSRRKTRDSVRSHQHECSRQLFISGHNAKHHGTKFRGPKPHWHNVQRPRNRKNTGTRMRCTSIHTLIGCGVVSSGHQRKPRRSELGHHQNF